MADANGCSPRLHGRDEIERMTREAVRELDRQAIADIEADLRSFAKLRELLATKRLDIKPAAISWD